MSFEIIFTKKFLEGIDLHKKSGSKNLLFKIDNFVTELRENPKFGTGNPEQLKYYSNTTWSRRIDKKHRLIYEISDEQFEVKLLSAWGHYNDK